MGGSQTSRKPPPARTCRGAVFYADLPSGQSARNIAAARSHSSRVFTTSSEGRHLVFRFSRFHFFALSASLLTLPGALPGQTGTVRGKVTSAPAAPLAAVIVTLPAPALPPITNAHPTHTFPV